MKGQEPVRTLRSHERPLPSVALREVSYVAVMIGKERVIRLIPRAIGHLRVQLLDVSIPESLKRAAAFDKLLIHIHLTHALRHERKPPVVSGILKVDGSSLAELVGRYVAILHKQRYAVLLGIGGRRHHVLEGFLRIKAGDTLQIGIGNDRH